MPSLRDIKRSARASLHNAMKVSAFYFDNASAMPVPITVRIHTKWDSTTMDKPRLSGTLVARQSIFPKLLFMIDELAAQGITLHRKGVIYIQPGEAYSLDNSEPIDLVSVSWIVTALDEDAVTAAIEVVYLLDASVGTTLFPEYESLFDTYINNNNNLPV